MKKMILGILVLCISCGDDVEKNNTTDPSKGWELGGNNANNTSNNTNPNNVNPNNVQPNNVQPNNVQPNNNPNNVQPNNQPGYGVEPATFDDWARTCEAVCDYQVRCDFDERDRCLEDCFGGIEGRSNWFAKDLLDLAISCYDDAEFCDNDPCDDVLESWHPDARENGERCFEFLNQCLPNTDNDVCSAAMFGHEALRDAMVRCFELDCDDRDAIVDCLNRAVGP